MVQKIEGIEISRMIQTRDEMTDELVCGLCKRIVFKGEMCSSCYKVFCERCITDYKDKNGNKCPNGEEYKKCDLMPLHQKFLKKMKFRCENVENGCKEEIEYSNIEDHRINCEYMITQCLNKGCPEKSIKKALAEHWTICKYHILDCKFCSKQFRRIELEGHEEDCEMRPIKCENKGCEVFIPKKDFSEHQATCPFALLPCEWCKMDKLRSEIIKHKKGCDLKPMECSGCKKTIVQMDLAKHISKCEEVIVCCHKCEEQLPRKELKEHDCIKEMAKTIRQLKSLVRNLVCKDCAESGLVCTICKKPKCLSCGYKTCEHCKKVDCKNCVQKCHKCTKLCCLNCLNLCGRCNGAICIACDPIKDVECSVCHKLHCKKCTANFIKRSCCCKKPYCPGCTFENKCFRCQDRICKECFVGKKLPGCEKCGKLACKLCFNLYQCWKCKTRFCKECRKSHKYPAECNNYLPGLAWEDLLSGKEVITDIPISSIDRSGHGGSVVQDSAGFIWSIHGCDEKLIHKLDPKTKTKESFELPFSGYRRYLIYDKKQYIYLQKSSQLIRINTIDGKIERMRDASKPFLDGTKGVFRNGKLYCEDGWYALRMFDPEKNEWKDNIFNIGAYINMLADPKNEDNIFFLKYQKPLELYSISKNKITKSFAEDSEYQLWGSSCEIICDSEDPDNYFILFLGPTKSKAINLKENVWTPLYWQKSYGGLLFFDGEKVWNYVGQINQYSEPEKYWRNIIFDKQTQLDQNQFTII
eukprot:TRINITY_DN11057_c3_g1_i1.p1 TRINITY_DN11057_c3_g1~~TRINITY_DN11057_c3_g1_i1.p1  ORF type:complete len:753 (+),score=42.76 TRINITY_DN11057_c3_g1_i1:214-2472(+)